MTKAIELLKAIGVTNEICEVKEATLAYESAVEKSWCIVTELGEIDFRIIRLSEKTVSKIDYCDTRYKFNRNVNLMSEYKGV